MNIIFVVGARPNFVKIAPIMRAMRTQKAVKPILVHTGQHYDGNMSDAFFRDLDIPRPDVFLGVGSGTHAEQTSRIMERFEKVLMREKPDLVLVVGDVNSTMACALTAVKLHIRVAHVEAGLRSFDRTMPEEINRIVTDHISDYLFTTCTEATKQLRKEGIPAHKIYFVGNVMIDTLYSHLRRLKIDRRAKKGSGEYALVTMHRPSNVDDGVVFKRISSALCEISKDIPIIFPIHPRTRKQIKKFGLEKYYGKNIGLLDPVGYNDLLKLYSHSKFVLTDSGGMQEETSVLGIPCLTLRNNTERPITVRQGTNTIVGTDRLKIIREARKILRSKRKKIGKIKYWDGRAAERIVKILARKCKN